MFTGKKFWFDALERAIKTFAQFLLTTGALDPLSSDLQTSIQTKLIGAGLAFIVSILTSIVSTGIGAPNTAAALPVESDTEKGHADTMLLIVAAAAFILGYLVCRVVG